MEDHGGAAGGAGEPLNQIKPTLQLVATVAKSREAAGQWQPGKALEPSHSIT